MMLTTVNSNAIHAIGYDPKTRQLEVTSPAAESTFSRMYRMSSSDSLRSPSKGFFPTGESRGGSGRSGWGG